MIMKISMYKMMLLFLVFIIPLVTGDKIVTTTNGPVRGTYLASKKVEAFLGIPYAEPPVGPLRFGKPVPRTAWEETYDANELPPSCIQAHLGKFHFFPDPDGKMSEDCLYLNLWVPEGGSDVKPIMVFIHGGGFMIGSTNMKIYDGAKLSQHGDVIVATINYRLGSLGFFSAFIEEASGSMGMYDQLMAIQWVKDNAAHFGGDPDNIVLFGESAGSFSVSLHMVSPLTKNLFRRGIMQSGSAFSPVYSEGNEALSVGSQMIANWAGCADDKKSLKRNPKEVVDCMKKLPAKKFSEIDLVYLKKIGMPALRVGDDFLPENPIDSFRKGEFKDTELFLGVTRDEGSLLLTVQKPEIFGMFGENIDPDTFNETFAEEMVRSVLKIDVDNKIIRSYFDRVKAQSGYTYLNAVSDAIGDFLITCGSVYQAEYHSLKNNPVYFYLFDYKSPSSPNAEWMGIAHFDEVQYVFGNPVPHEFTEYEKEFSKDIIDMWTAFAKTGNPNIRGGVKWPQYTYEDPKYFIISKQDKVGIRPDNFRCEAWRGFFRSEMDDNVIQALKKSTV